MKRRLLNLAAAILRALSLLSALLFTVFAASSLRWYLQPHSGFYSSFIRWSPTRHTDIAVSNQLEVRHIALHKVSYELLRDAIDWKLLGFTFRLARHVNGSRFVSGADDQTIKWGPVANWRIRIPGWACLLVTAMLPSLQVKRYLAARRENRVHRGLCVCCGYDLRESPERCPECGTAKDRR
jgi:Zn ribbon nucleic-acid-binding protein